MKKEHKILNELKIVFEKSGFNTLASAIDDYSKGKMTESTLEEILFEWNTKINPQYTTEESEGKTIRKLLRFDFINLGGTYIRPVDICSIKQDTIYDYKSHKEKYLIIINSDETDNKMLYKDLTIAFDSEKERSNELNWLKEILTFYGTTFQDK